MQQKNNREEIAKLLKDFDLQQAQRIMARIDLIEEECAVVETEIEKEVKDGVALKDKYNFMVKYQSKNKRKAIVAVARKLAELLYIILKTEKPYEKRNFCQPSINITGMTEVA